MQYFIQKPPYCSVRAFKKGLNLLRGCAAGETINTGSLMETGVSPNASYSVLHALKFFEFIDQDGRVTGGHQVFFKPEEDRRTSLENLVRKKYRLLLEKVAIPVTEMQELQSAFQEVFTSAESVAVLNQSFFLWIAREAGVSVFGARRPAPRRRETRTGESDHRALSIVLADPRDGKNREAGRTGIVCQLQITPETSTRDIVNMLKRVHEALKLVDSDGDPPTT